MFGVFSLMDVFQAFERCVLPLCHSHVTNFEKQFVHAIVFKRIFFISSATTDLCEGNVLARQSKEWPAENGNPKYS